MINFNKIFSRSKQPEEVFVPIPGSLIFQCNICSTENTVKFDQIDREISSCKKCQSTVRMRQLMHILSMELFGRPLAMQDFPVDKGIVGIGMSDWVEYANILAEKFSYQNTFYTEEPRLDITNPAPELEGTADFVISTDVFEHVNSPVDRAFVGTHKVLKKGGLFLLSVPYGLGAKTIEHFPGLADFRIDQDSSGNYFLTNKTANGEIQTFTNLVFHGGPGQTLEMRVFCEKELLAHLEKAGFTDVKIWKKPYFEFGVYNQQPWSLPVTAKRI